MTVLVEVGPNTVRAQRNPPGEWVAVAMDCIDDDHALLDDRLVAVTDLWRDVLVAACGDQPGEVVCVLPSWWPDTRVAVVTRALEHEAATYTRLELLTAHTGATVIEVADDLVLVAAGADEPAVLDRRAMDLTSRLGGVAEVLIDVPAGVAPLPREVIAELRGAGIRLGHAGRQRFAPPCPEPVPIRRRPQGRRVAAGLAAVVAAGTGWALQPGAPPAGDEAVWLIEGPAGMQVPGHWTVERVTAGPGSARVQVSDPVGTAALHLTRAPLTAPAELVASLQSAIAAETPGVFVDFQPDGRVGDRPAVTYREVRARSHTRWAVVTDGATKIAVGCQSAPTDDAGLQHICTRAVESARIFD